jgi:serine/threonine protein kinase
MLPYSYDSDNEEVKSGENELKIGNDFKINLTQKLGSGSFGDIFKGYNVKTGEEVAVKVESNKIKTPQLNYESRILKTLQGGSILINKNSRDSNYVQFLRFGRIYNNDNRHS